MDEQNSKESTLVETTQQDIIDFISQKGLKVNDVLPKENEFVDILGVSRVVIREALSGLRTLGILETKKKKGTILISPQPFNMITTIINSGTLNDNSIRDLYELRLMLEVGLADFLFERKDEKKMAELKSLVEEEEACEDIKRLIDIDIEFHSILYRMANSKSLSNFQNLLGRIFTLYPNRRPDNWRQLEVISHRSLYRILETGNAETFRSAMRLHLTYQFENRDKYLQNYNNTFHIK